MRLIVTMTLGVAAALAVAALGFPANAATSTWADSVRITADVPDNRDM